MSWFKKAATDDGGLRISRTPGAATNWKITRKNPTIVPGSIQLKKKNKKSLKRF